MALVNVSIPSLVGGVSQQPAPVRHPSQVTAMTNMLPSVSNGLGRRPGTRHVRPLASGVDWSNTHIHAINRGSADDFERYHVVITDGDLKVFDWDGLAKTVSFPDGKTYLAAASPRENFACVTVADTTFIVNKTKTVAMSAYTPSSVAQQLYYVVKLGVPKTTYSITVGPNTFSHTTTDTDYKSDYVATQLATAIDAHADWGCTQYGNLLVIQHATTDGWSWSTFDSYGDQASFAFWRQVNRYETLPAKFVEGPIVEVTGDPNASNDSYYVTWKKNATGNGGVWQETRSHTVDYALSATTMPHKLVRNPDGTFTFSKITWEDRKVGNDDSNPHPSFVGSTINDIFFFRNRLGLLTDESLVLSSAGNYYDYWAESARIVIDSDPIDVTAATNKVSFLRHAVPFDKALLVMSDKQQFQFSSGEILSPKSARLDPTTSFDASATCRPVNLGKNVFFATDRGAHTAIREYYFDGNTVNNDATDVTAHVPTYLPLGVYHMAVAQTEDMAFALSTAERNVVYVYNSYWNGDEKVQSAWHKWVWDPAEKILSVNVFGAIVSLCIERSGTVCVEHLYLDANPALNVPYLVCLDRLALYVPGVASYSSGTDRTTWTTPYTILGGAVPVVVVIDKAGQVGQGLIPRQDSPNTVSLKGNYSTCNTYVGMQYLSEVVLSTVDPRDSKGNAIIAARMQVRDAQVVFVNSGYFEAHVHTTAGSDYTYVYSGNTVGINGFVLGTEALASGRFTIPVMAKSDEAEVTLQNRTHLPSTFLAAEWQGVVAMQASRR